MSDTTSKKDGNIFSDLRNLPSKGLRIICTIPEYICEDSSWLGTWKKHTVYIIKSISIGTDTPLRGTVKRRYKEFYNLYCELYAKYGAEIIPEFLVSRNPLTEDHFSHDFITARQLLLADWLNRTINLNDNIQNDDLILDFLKITKSRAGDEALGGTNTCAQFSKIDSGNNEDDNNDNNGPSNGIIKNNNGNNGQLTTMFSVTATKQVAITEKDRDFLPSEGTIMSVYRITDDDL